MHAAMTAIVSGERVRLGFRARRSHTLIDLAECPVLDAQIVAALPALREIAVYVAVRSARGDTELRVDIAALAGGLDVGIEGTGKLPDVTLPVLPAETADTPRPTGEVK